MAAQLPYPTNENQSYTPKSIVYTVDFNKRSITPEIVLDNASNDTKDIPQNTQPKSYQVAAPILDQKYINTAKIQKTKVQPILKEDYHRFKDYFLNKPQRFKANILRDYTWFVFAYHTGRRASDFTKVRVCDVMNTDGTIKDYWHIEREQKTGKKSTVPLNEYAKEALVQYFVHKSENNIQYAMSDYIFQNYAYKEKRCDAKNTNQDNNYTSSKHLTTENCRVILKRAAKELDIKYNVGSHSPRKSLGAMAAKCSDDPTVEEMLCEVYEHGSKSTTRIYMEQNIKNKKEFMEDCGRYMEEM